MWEGAHLFLPINLDAICIHVLLCLWNFLPGAAKYYSDVWLLAAHAEENLYGAESLI